MHRTGDPTHLNTQELIEIEQVLDGAITKHNAKQKETVLKHNQNKLNTPITTTDYELQLKKYKRQYIAVINRKGEKEVFVNLFCDASNWEFWPTKLVQIEDGGNCYFNLKVNMQTMSNQLEVNYNAM